MKTALHTDLFRKFSIEDAIPLIAQSGYEYIELNAIPYWTPHVNLFDFDSKRKDNLKKLLMQYNLKVIAIGTNTDLAILDRSERLRNVKYCIDGIKMSAELGCHLVCTTFSGNVLLSFQKQKQAFQESLIEISKAGVEYNVELAIELHPGSFIDSTLRAVNLLKSFDLPNVGYLFCFPHIATFAGEDLIQALKIAKDYTIHFHLADTPLCANDHKHMMPESGEINFPKMISEIKKSGFDDRYLTIEIYSEDEHPLENAIKSKALIDNLLNQSNKSESKTQ